MAVIRKTKILATLGPASSSREVIEELILAGADGFRLNFSHGDGSSFAPIIAVVRELSARHQHPVALLQDLQGPKIRTGLLKNHQPVELKTGNKIRITTQPIEGDEDRISTAYRALPQDVKPGDRILIDDGAIELRVLSTSSDEVEAEILVGGILKEKKGINLPGVRISASSMTEKDYADAQFGIEAGVDYIALSFVRTAGDVLCLKNLINEKKSDVAVIAKIEKPEAINNLKEILEVSDGVMVARGDLGVEMPAEKVPLLQKMIIERANKAEKLVIVATQMLESMVENVRPTRAEASDVANAILDGTDVAMLSQETAVGKHPVRSVQTMATIAQYTEADEEMFDYTERLRPQRFSDFTHAVVLAARTAAVQMKARAIAVFTRSGFTARLASCQRPPCPIYAFTPDLRTYQKLALVWGVTPFLFAEVEKTDEMIRRAEKMLLDKKLLHPGDVLIIVSGTQRVRGATNMMKVDRVGMA